MKLLYKESDVENIQVIKYNLDEESFYTEPFGNPDISVLLKESYVCIDFKRFSLKAVGINGFSPKGGWKKARLTVPDHKNGEIFINEFAGEDGSAVEYGDAFTILHDKKICCLCKAEYRSEQCIHIRFMKNAIAAMKDNELQAIWIELE